MDSTEASLDSVHPLAQSKPPTQDPTYQPKLKPPLPAPNPPHSHRHPSSSAHFHTPDPHPALHPIPYPTLPSPPPKLSAPTLLSPSQPPNPTSTVSSRPPPALPIQSHPAHQTTTPPVQSSSSLKLTPQLQLPLPFPALPDPAPSRTEKASREPEGTQVRTYCTPHSLLLLLRCAALPGRVCGARGESGRCAAAGSPTAAARACVPCRSDSDVGVGGRRGDGDPIGRVWVGVGIPSHPIPGSVSCVRCSQLRCGDGKSHGKMVGGRRAGFPFFWLFFTGLPCTYMAGEGRWWSALLGWEAWEMDGMAWHGPGRGERVVGRAGHRTRASTRVMS